ncbi:MAG: PEP-CTERM sorting domain-containing protein [Planctomycetes bacterium]|nr:PEP-CTERM sorting domain-containing protein [Planctomycetota bacterium]
MYFRKVIRSVREAVHRVEGTDDTDRSTTIKHRGRCCILALVFLAVCGTARGEFLFGLTTEFTTELRATQLAYLDKSTGAVIQSFAFQSDIELQSAAMDDADSTLYAWSTFGFVGLGSVDTTSGVFTPIGPGSAQIGMSALAIHPATGELYGMTWPGALFLIDKSNGATALIGSDPSLQFAHGLAFSPDGILYASETRGHGIASRLSTIALDTGQASFVGTIQRDFVVSLDFDMDGILYGTDNGEDQLGIIDTSTGWWTDVGSLGTDRGFAIAFAVPEPTTVTVLALGALFLTRRRR